MNDDLISRQDAVDEIARWIGYLDDDMIGRIQFGLKRLPSTQPERKKGEWINRSLNILYPEFERYTCSVCGKHSYSYDFCPNCGADMRGEQDGNT